MAFCTPKHERVYPMIDELLKLHAELNEAKQQQKFDAIAMSSYMKSVFDKNVQLEEHKEAFDELVGIPIFVIETKHEADIFAKKLLETTGKRLLWLEE